MGRRNSRFLEIIETITPEIILFLLNSSCLRFIQLFKHFSLLLLLLLFLNVNCINDLYIVELGYVVQLVISACTAPQVVLNLRFFITIRF